MRRRPCCSSARFWFHRTTASLSRRRILHCCQAPSPPAATALFPPHRCAMPSQLPAPRVWRQAVREASARCGCLRSGARGAPHDVSGHGLPEIAAIRQNNSTFQSYSSVFQSSHRAIQLSPPIAARVAHHRTRPRGSIACRVGRKYDASDSRQRGTTLFDRLR